MLYPGIGEKKDKKETFTDIYNSSSILQSKITS